MQNCRSVARKGRLVYAPRGWGTWRQISFVDEALDGENESVDYRGASEASSKCCEQNEPKNSWIDQGLVEKQTKHSFRSMHHSASKFDMDGPQGLQSLRQVQWLNI
ncbi:hypothetical protein C8R44DRAFT_728853 [Mycena epipterygia]|nr:hypothetical protein C8R44DRAFT_728853 [Mycena epipterygia]